MQKLKYFVVLMVSLIAALTGSMRQVAAQENTRTIPIPLMGFLTAFSPDGKTLALAAETNLYMGKVEPALVAIHLFDLASGKETAMLAGTQTDFVTGLRYSPDGKQLVSLHNNGDLLLWDIGSGKVIHAYTMPFFGVRLPVFFPDGKRLALLGSSNPSRILIVDLATGAITAHFGLRLKTYAEFQASFGKFPGMGDISYITFDLSPDGKTLAAATFNDEILLWDVASGKQATLAAPNEKKVMINVRPVLFTPDGKALMYYHRQQNKLFYWEMASQKERDLKVTGGANFALNAQGDKVAWLDKSQVYTWDFRAEQPTPVATLDAALKALPSTALYFTPDNKSLIVAGLTINNSKNLIYVITLP